MVGAGASGEVNAERANGGERLVWIKRTELVMAS